MLIKLNLLVILILLNITTSFGQKQEKYFYNVFGKECSEGSASHYLIVDLDKNNIPVGVIKDYYLTGELSIEFEGALYIDRDSFSNSKFIGKGTTYRKNGLVWVVSYFNKNGERYGDTAFFEDGKIESVTKYQSGKFQVMTNYHKSGKLASRIVHGNKWVIECDEFNKCNKFFVANFMDKSNPDNWPLASTSDHESRILTEKGEFVMKTFGPSNSYFNQLIYEPIDIKKDFSIQTDITFNNGDRNSGQGMIWGFKDWNNYNYFYINANGYYTIGAFSEGLLLELVKWEQSEYLSKDVSRNRIKVSKIGDLMVYSINSRIVTTKDFFNFKGNNLGFNLLGGPKEIIINSLIINQDIEYNLENPNENSVQFWKGNGTGFFIDPRGYICTNYHVIENASEIEIDIVQNGQKFSYKAKIISVDKMNDLAIIKIEDPKFAPPSKLPYSFKTKTIDVGSSVFTLGYPMALSSMGVEVKFTDGKISSKTGFQGDITSYQVSVPIQPGNSGGPLFDNDGNIVGIINSKIMAADNVSYAIKSSYLKSLIDVVPESLNLPNDIGLLSKPLTTKIKLLSDFVVLIKIK